MPRNSIESISCGPLQNNNCHEPIARTPVLENAHTMSTAPSTPDTSVFNKDRHIKYWLRCLKSFLPTGYTSNDSNRMTLALFTLSALDLLGVLHEKTTANERRDWIEWIYLCQHPEGGFRGFTGTDFGDELRNEENQHWDPANLAGTFFALAALAVLGDDFGRVRRRQCLEWLKKLQWEDGSFGEVLGEGGRIEGKRDVRYSFLAALVRWILRGEKGDVDGSVGDIDVDALAGFITASQVRWEAVYIFPMADRLTQPDIRGRDSQSSVPRSPRYALCRLCRWVEMNVLAHMWKSAAGWTYCGIGALSLLGRLPSIHRPAATPGAVNSSFVEDMLHWLVMRQTSMLSEDDDGNDDEEAGSNESHAQEQEGLAANHSASVAAPTERTPPHSMESNTNETNIEDLHWAGFNGRCNKVADTCYSFWVGGSLSVSRIIVDYAVRNAKSSSDPQKSPPTRL